MKIAFVASEANPYVKTGGLADVAAALPKALKRRGHDVVLILPRYRMSKIDERVRPLGLQVAFEFDYQAQYAAIFHDPSAEVPTFFVDAPQYFARHERNPYGDWDDPERFAYFCRAACETIRHLGPAPDVVQVNDWMTALVPAHVRATYGSDPYWSGTGTLITIHTLAFQGLFAPRALPQFGFHPAPS